MPVHWLGQCQHNRPHRCKHQRLARAPLLAPSQGHPVLQAKAHPLGVPTAIEGAHGANAEALWDRAHGLAWPWLPRPGAPTIRMVLSGTSPIAFAVNDTTHEAPENPLHCHVPVGGTHRTWPVPCTALLHSPLARPRQTTGSP